MSDTKELTKDVHDFLIEKFGYFNSAHPLNHLGYAKGITPDIEDIENAIKEYADQQSAEKNKEIERLKGLIKIMHDRHLVTKKDREGLWLYFAKENNL